MRKEMNEREWNRNERKETNRIKNNAKLIVSNKTARIKKKRRDN